MRLEHLLSGESQDRRFLVLLEVCIEYIERKMRPSLSKDEVELNQKASPIAQLVRALH